MPVARFITENATLVPRPSTFSPSRPRRHQQLQRARVDELRQPPRRVEEVERVAGRRRVEHEQVVAALLAQLVELLHRHVLLRAGHRVGQLLVDAVGEHRVAGALVRRVPVDQLVEGALGVEHHRPQLAVHAGVDAALLVAQLGQPERVGQPPRRVDRQHRHLLAARRHAERDRRRRGRLADAAGARADADLLALEPVLDHSASSSRSESSSSSRRRGSGSNRYGSVDDRRAHLRAQPLELLALSATRARARPAPTPTAACAGLRAARRRAPRRRRASAALKRSGSTPLATTWSTSMSELVAQPLLEVDRLVDRHLLGQRHRTPRRWPSGSRRNPSIGAAWRAIGPTRAMLRVGARRAQQRQRRGRWRARP